MAQFAISAVSTSSDQAGFLVAKLANGFAAGTASDRWATAGGVTAAWARFDLGTAKVANWYQVSPGDGGATQDPKDWTFEGSVDGTTGWTVLDTRTAQVFNTDRRARTFTFANSAAFRYYRINISAGNGSTIVSIGEMWLGGGDPTSRGFSSAQAGLGGGGGNYTLGTLFTPAVDGTVTGIRVRSNSGTAAFTVRVYNSAGTILASETSNVDVPAGAWYTVPLTTPLAVTGGTTYMAAWRVTDAFGTHSAALPWVDNDITVPASGAVSFAGSTTHSRYVDGDGFPVNFTGNTYAVTAEFERAVADPTVTGTIAGTSPTGVGSLTGTAPTTGTIAGTSPVGGGSLVGVLPIVGTLDGTAPAGVGGLAGTLPATGAIAGTSPVGVGSLAGTVPTPGATTGTIGGTSPVGYGDLDGDTGIVDAPGWDLELSGDALIGVDTDETWVFVPPPVATPPAGLTVGKLVRQSYLMPRLTAENAGKLVGVTNPDPADPYQYQVIEETVGAPHVWVDGVDRTYDDSGVMLTVDDMVVQRGMGDQSARIDVHGMQLWHEKGVGAWSWLKGGAQVLTGFVRDDGGVHYWWAGDLLDDNTKADTKTFANTWRAFGPLMALRAIMHQPDFTMDPVEMGRYIPDLLNRVVGRTWATIRYPRNPRNRIPNGNPGAIGETVDSHVRAILGKAWESNGRPWALIPDQQARRLHRLERVNIDDVHWTFTAGAPGVTLDLDEDWSEVINVYFGRGVSKDGHRWLNFRYPYYLPYTPPGYFSADVDDELVQGSTDADTVNGGVSLLQRRLQELGYDVEVTGVFDADTEAAVLRVQRDRGLTRDGRVGGQTWTAVWSVGSMSGLLRFVRRPLAADPRVEPYLWLPNGAIAGPNPIYDRSIPRRETELDYGPRTTRAEGERDSEERLARTREPILTGTITVTTCPHEGTRWEMDASQNISLLGYRGRDPFLHIAQLTRSLSKGSVQALVSSTFEDALTVLERRRRNAESRRDPARRPGVWGRTSSSTMLDSVTPFDGESPAGKIAELVLRHDKWTVWPVPMDEVGTLQSVVAQTWGPAAKFTLHLFGLPVTPAQLHSALGNPLTQSRPWEKASVKRFLDAHGYIDGWGHLGQACGYEQMRESSEDAVLNGKFEATSGVEYRNPKPFMYVAVLAADNTRFKLRLRPKPVA